MIQIHIQMIFNIKFYYYFYQINAYDIIDKYFLIYFIYLISNHNYSSIKDIQKYYFVFFIYFILKVYIVLYHYILFLLIYHLYIIQ